MPSVEVERKVTGADPDAVFDRMRDFTAVFAVIAGVAGSSVTLGLVPALMVLMGRWNWWTPAWLRSVHARIGAIETPSMLRP